jgi:hypothetical protein
VVEGSGGRLEALEEVRGSGRGQKLQRQYSTKLWRWQEALEVAGSSGGGAKLCEDAKLCGGAKPCEGGRCETVVKVRSCVKV